MDRELGLGWERVDGTDANTIVEKGEVLKTDDLDNSITDGEGEVSEIFSRGRRRAKFSSDRCRMRGPRGGRA